MATTDAAPRVVDVQAFIDAQPVSPLQKLLLSLCFLVIAIDGFDTAIIGFNYLMTNWMTTLLQQASGASIADAAVVGAMYQVGGTLGAILVGRLMDRFEPHRVLFASYLTGAVCIVLISLSTDRRGLMTLAVFAAGACISGGQVGGNALSAAFYPTPYRATGVAWANGIGRGGSIVGSLLGGLLLGLGWPAKMVYALVAIPAVMSALALGTLGLVRRRELNQFSRSALPTN